MADEGGGLPLGSAYVEIVARLDSLDKGLAEARRQTKETTDKMEADFGRLQGFFRGFGNAAAPSFLKITSAVAAGELAFHAFTEAVHLAAVELPEFIRKSLEATGKIGEQARQLGLSSRAYQEYSFAAKRAGVEQGAFDSAIANLTRRIGEAQSGVGEAAESFAALGVKVKTANGDARATESVLGDVIQKLGSYKSASDVAAASSDVLGKTGGPVMNALLEKGASGVRHLREEAQRLGIVLDDQTIAAANDASTKLALLGEVFRTKVAAEIAKVAPEIADIAEKLLDAVPDIAAYVSSWIKGATQVVGAIERIAKARGLLDFTPREQLQGEVDTHVGASRLARQTRFDLLKKGAPTEGSPDAKYLAALDDEIAKQDAAARAVRDKIKALDDGSGATRANTGETEKNTDAGDRNTGSYANRKRAIHESAAETKDAASALESLRESLTAEIAANQAEISVIQDGIAKGQSYEEIQVRIGIAHKLAEASAKGASGGVADLAAELEKLVGPLTASVIQAKQFAEAASFVTQATEQTAELEAQKVAFDAVIAAGGDYVTAERAAAIAAAEAKNPIKEGNEGYDEQQKKLHDAAAALFDHAHAYDADTQAAKTNEDAQLDINLLREQIEIYQQQAVGLLSVEDATRRLAIAEKERQAAAEHRTAAPGELQAAGDLAVLQRQAALVQQAFHDSEADIRRGLIDLRENILDDVSGGFIDALARSDNAFDDFWKELERSLLDFGKLAARELIFRPLLDASGLGGLLTGQGGGGGGFAGLLGGGGGSGVSSLTSLFSVGQKLSGAFGSLSFDSLPSFGSSLLTAGKTLLGFGAAATSAASSATTLASGVGTFANVAAGGSSTAAAAGNAAAGAGGGISAGTGALAAGIGFAVIGAVTNAMATINTNKGFFTNYQDYGKAYTKSLGFLGKAGGILAPGSLFAYGGSSSANVQGQLGLLHGNVTAQGVISALFDVLPLIFAAFANLSTGGTLGRHGFEKFVEDKDLGTLFSDNSFDRTLGQEDIRNIRDQRGQDFPVAARTFLGESGGRLGLTPQEIQQGKGAGLLYRSLLGDKVGKEEQRNLGITAALFANLESHEAGATEALDTFQKIIAGLPPPPRALAELNAFFQSADNDIAASDYLEGLQGLVQVWYKDLPAGIYKAQIVQDLFTKNGVVGFEELDKTMRGAAAAIPFLTDAISQTDLSGIIDASGLIDDTKVNAAFDDLAERLRVSMADAMNSAVVDGLLQGLLQPQLFAPFMNQWQDIATGLALGPDAEGGLSEGDAQAQFDAALANFDAALAASEPSIRAILVAGAHFTDALDRWSKKLDTIDPEVTKGFNQGIQDQLYALAHPIIGAAVPQFAALLAAQKDRIANATAVGGDLEQVALLNAFEKKKFEEDALKAIEDAHEEEMRAIDQESEEQRRVHEQRRDQLQQELDQIREQRAAAREAIGNLLKQMTATTASPLATSVALANAQARFQALKAPARAGDVKALEEIPEAASALDALARTFFATGPNYAPIFADITATLKELSLDTSGLSPGDQAMVDAIASEEAAINTVDASVNAQKAAVTAAIKAEQGALVAKLQELIDRSTRVPASTGTLAGDTPSRNVGDGRRAIRTPFIGTDLNQDRAQLPNPFGSFHGLPHFAEGGVVPGATGVPQLAVVHGGEEVLTPAQRQLAVLKARAQQYVQEGVAAAYRIFDGPLGWLAPMIRALPKDFGGFGVVHGRAHLDPQGRLDLDDTNSVRAAAQRAVRILDPDRLSLDRALFGATHGSLRNIGGDLRTRLEAEFDWIVGDLFSAFDQHYYFFSQNFPTDIRGARDEATKLRSLAHLFEALDKDVRSVAIPSFSSSGAIDVFAAGGVTNRPSIFGESGWEAAIPLTGGREIPIARIDFGDRMRAFEDGLAAQQDLWARLGTYTLPSLDERPHGGVAGYEGGEGSAEMRADLREGFLDTVSELKATRRHIEGVHDRMDELVAFVESAVGDLRFSRSGSPAGRRVT